LRLLLLRAPFTLRLLHLRPSPSLCGLSHRITLNSLLFKLLLLLFQRGSSPTVMEGFACFSRRRQSSSLLHGNASIRRYRARFCKSTGVTFFL
jgi:hypothetical protein